MGAPMTTPFHHHGGRLSAARAAFPRAPRPWLDLSTGINPQPWSGPRATADDLARLPDPDALAELERLAAAAFGADPARVCAVPGAEAGLRALPALTGARSVAIAQPTYDGHAQAWAAAGLTPKPVTFDALQAATAEALVVVQPNNPDGTRLDPAALEALARHRSERGRWTILDESFVDATPRLSLAGAAVPRLVVLRSFGKFYGLAGVRLGFVLAEPALVERLRARLGDWPISAEALAAGRGAYADPDWAAATRARLAEDGERLAGLLAAAGFEPVGANALFRLVRHPDAAARFEALCRAGVLVRPFPHDPTWLRFGLPPAGHWSRLQSALETLP